MSTIILPPSAKRHRKRAKPAPKPTGKHVASKPATTGKPKPPPPPAPPTGPLETAVLSVSTDLFVMDSSGLYFLVDADDDNGRKHRSRVSDSFQIIGNVSDAAGSSYGTILRWRDDRRRQKQQIIPLRSFASKGNEVCAQLLDGGLRIDNPKMFLKYVWKHGRAAPKAHLATATGWFDDDRFILPDVPDGSAGHKKIGDDCKVIYAPTSEIPHSFNTSGTLAEWQENVGKRCVGNSRLVLAVCCAVAGPLLKPMNRESGGVHLRGPSTIGKSTGQQVAGSVVGGGGQKGFVRSWHATRNGIEAVAALHNDAVLILDELALVDTRDAIQVVYMLANDAGKNRMNQDGTLRPTSKWRLVILSSGEISLSNHAGAPTRGGSEVRLLDINADAGRDLGLFEDLHGAESPKAFADELKEAALRFYGTAFREFVRILSGIEPDTRRDIIAAHQSDFLAQCELTDATPEVGRAASRLALFAAAGEMAIDFDILPWPSGEAIKQVLVCFKSWVAGRGGKRVAHDEEQMVSQIRLYLEKFGQSRFEAAPAHKVSFAGVGSSDPQVRDRAGFRRNTPDGGVEFLCLPEMFKTEVCKGYDSKAVLKALDKRGYLRRQGRELKIKTTVAGSTDQLRVYCILGSILEGSQDQDEQDEQD